MEAAMGLPPPPLKLSDALSLENMVNASGKLGGVAGVLAGVHIWEGRGGRVIVIITLFTSTITHLG